MKYRVLIMGVLSLFIASCASNNNSKETQECDTAVATNIQKANPGTIDLYENFESEYFPARNVLVWLPENYSPDTRYAVLYMHDAQMIYDETTSWNKQTWNIDSVASATQNDGRCRPFIVVGVENNDATRLVDYMPEKVVDYLPEGNGLLEKLGRDNLAADNYLRFLVEELKPFIDSKYSTLTDADNTVVMGSSMGGLISLYALTEYPTIFGGAGCLSTHTPVAVDDVEVEAPIWSKAFRDYLTENLPAVGANKVYMDYGDQTLDANYAPFQQQVDALFASLGWGEENFKSLFFEGHAHDEVSWQKRLDIPVTWLLNSK